MHRHPPLPPSALLLSLVVALPLWASPGAVAPPCEVLWRDLPSAHLARQGILSVGVVDVQPDEVRVAALCLSRSQRGKSFFLLAPGAEPIELFGDPAAGTGNLLCTDDRGPVPYAVLRPRKNVQLPKVERAFILLGKRGAIRSLRLGYTPLKEEPIAPCGEESGSADKKALRLTAPGVPILYFQDEGRSGICAEDRWGSLVEKQCVEHGHRLGDCPKGGPEESGIGGRPVGVFSLQSGATAERFLLLDATWWEFYGFSLLPLREPIEREPGAERTVFEQPCSGS